MPGMEKAQKVIPKKIQTLKFRLGLRLDDVLFPLDARELMQVLAQAGYSVPPQIPADGARLRVGFGGEIARKNGIVIDGNSDRGILGVTGKTPTAVISAYNELCAIVNNSLKIDIEGRSRFFEIIAEYKVESNKSPLESVRKVFGSNQILMDINKILKHNVSMYSLRLASEGKMPNQEEWSDITIEPDIIKPDLIYNISVIFRSKQKKIVEEFGKELETRLSEVIDTIESLS